MGKILAPFRKQLVIAAKFGFNLDPIASTSLAGLNSQPDHIKRVAEESLNRLNIDAIGLYHGSVKRIV